MKPCHLVALIFLGGTSVHAAEPIFRESLDAATPEQGNVKLLTPTAVGDGRVGGAVLLERRTENLLREVSLQSPATDAWILLDGGTIQQGHLTLPEGAAARQVIPSLETKIAGVKAEGIYCFSLSARAAKGDTARIALSWDGAETESVKEFTVGREWQRIWIAARNGAGSGSTTVTVRGVEGTVDVEKPQFEEGGTVPTSFLDSEVRGVSGLVWMPEENAFDQNKGTISFWIKPEWAGETMTGAKTLFQSSREELPDWKEMKSVIVLNAWLTRPEANDWQYGLNLRITDKALKSTSLSVPLHELTKDWHHIALTWDLSNPQDGRAAIYIDGELRASDDQIHSSGMEPATAVFFGQGGGGYLDGWLDEARIYNVELSANDVKVLSEAKE
ncbi:MAG: LamG domain-containing protein [Chthoniobacterales bacterium]|nr:LamG domain-containing protein [Chthoniobacterales bacterium]